MQVRFKGNSILFLSNPVRLGCLLLALLIGSFCYANTRKPVTNKITTFGSITLGFDRPITPVLKADALIVATNPPDQHVTVCGNSTTLNTTQVAGYSNPSWNDGSTGTSLTVTSSGTYWWQETGTNIVVNGDFSSGNTGFTSSYTYEAVGNACSGCCCGVLSSEGTYAVTNNPINVHTQFTSFKDHTSGSGNMLVVNGASTPNVTVWAETISVMPNTDYVFSTWVTSANAVAPATLQFSINGSPLGTTIQISSSLADGVWQYFTTTWNSGSISGNVPIALVNQNTAANGNDFAVDDIVFAPVYRQNIVVTLNPNPVLVVTRRTTACGSYDLTKSITGYDPNTYTYLIKDAANNVVANAQTLTQGGVYTITEQNKITGCQSAPKTVTVTINPNPQKPGITSL